MTTSWSPRNFEVTRRGYAPQQVDETFAALVRDLTTLRDQRDALQRQLVEAGTPLIPLLGRIEMSVQVIAPPAAGEPSGRERSATVKTKNFPSPRTAGRGSG